jgi:hypothetical protein
VVDVSVPEAPVEAGHYSTPSRAQDVTLDGPYAYVADAWGGLLILRYAPICPDPLAAVAIEGPVQGTEGDSYQFEADVEPLGATRPITYTWEPDPVLGQGTPEATYSWSIAGTYPLTVTANHCGGTVTGTLTVTIEPLSRVYLPLVLRNH